MGGVIGAEVGLGGPSAFSQLHAQTVSPGLPSPLCPPGASLPLPGEIYLPRPIGLGGEEQGVHC